MPLRLCRIEQPFELWIGIIGELAGDDRALPGEEQQFGVLRHVADLIRGEQRSAGMVFAVGDPRLFGIERLAHGLEHGGFLAEQIGDEAGAFVIVDAEYLQDAGVRQEGAGTLPVCEGIALVSR